MIGAPLNPVTPLAHDGYRKRHPRRRSTLEPPRSLRAVKAFHFLFRFDESILRHLMRSVRETQPDREPQPHCEPQSEWIL